MISINERPDEIHIFDDTLLIEGKGADMESAFDNFIRELFQEYDKGDVGQKLQIKKIMWDMMFDGLYYAVNYDE